MTLEKKSRNRRKRFRRYSSWIGRGRRNPLPVPEESMNEMEEMNGVKQRRLTTVEWMDG